MLKRQKKIIKKYFGIRESITNPYHLESAVERPELVCDGIRPDLLPNPVKDALVMGVSFVVAAFIPITPYLFLDGKTAIPVSVAASLIGLFVLGVGKGRIVQKSPLLQGLEIVGIGVVSAGIGYGLGDLIPRILG